MSTFEDRNKGLPGQFEAEIEVDRDVVVIESEEAQRVRRNPLAALPLLLGVIFLLANVLVVSRVPGAFTAKNVNGAVSLMLLLVSVALSLAVIVHGLAARRSDSEEIGEGRDRPLRTVGVPLLLALLAPLFTLWGLQVSKSVGERNAQSTKPCIEVYEKAAAIAKDNPRFRMLDTDRDEVRCKVNAALGR
jgi:hypothetical protein